MKAYIIVEGPFDAELLKSILPEELMGDIEIVSAGGVSAAKSLARSLIVRRQVPVAIILDADSLVPELIQERRDNIEEILESIAVDTSVKVILAVPEIEAIFFSDSSILTHVLGHEPTQEILDRATFQPRKTLDLLTESNKIHSRFQITNRLTSKDIEILRKTPVIQEIIHFLQFVQESASDRAILQ